MGECDCEGILVGGISFVVMVGIDVERIDAFC